jgi:hypothetical protein
MYVTRSITAMIGLVTLLAAREARPQVTPGNLDPFICNMAKRAPKEPKFTYLSPPLTDRFQTNAAYQTKKEDYLCMPTVLGAGQDPLQPLIKLQGFKISSTATSMEEQVAVQDLAINPALQTLKVGKPDRILIRTGLLELGTFKLKNCKKDADCSTQVGHPFCVNKKCLQYPGLASLVSDPFSVDNFKCYRVTPGEGEPPFPSTTVPVSENYAFLNPGAIRNLQAPYQIVRPRHLCMPVDKGGENIGAQDHPLVLMCYQVKRSAAAKFVNHRASVATSFSAQMRIDEKGSGPKELCVPACVMPNCP